MLPDYPPTFWFCAVAAVVIFGIAKAGFGSGIGIVATPLLSLTIPVTDAVGLLLPLLIITDVFSVNHYRMRFSRRSIKLLLPGALLGIAIGSLFFSSFRDNERILRFAIGVLALWFVLFQAFRAMILGVLEKRRPHATKGILMEPFRDLLPLWPMRAVHQSLFTYCPRSSLATCSLAPHSSTLPL